MNSLIIEHVSVSELPEDWRARLHAVPTARVTVRIEEEIDTAAPEALAEDPAFGIWQDRTDMDDVEAHLRQLREPRYRRDDSHGGK